MWKRENEPDAMAENQPAAPRVTPPQPRAAGGGGEPAVIGPSITVKGDISGQEDLLIQGRVEGKVDLKQNQVTVGRKGRLKADLHGRMIVVEGQVEGNLFGSEQVVLRASSSVRGNITAPRVSLDDGTNFKGAIDMEPHGERRPGEAPDAAAPAARERRGGESKPETAKLPAAPGMAK